MDEFFKSKKGSGCPKKVKLRNEREIKRMCITDRFQHAGTINSIFYETTGVKITTRSIQNVLNNIGLRVRRLAEKATSHYPNEATAVRVGKFTQNLDCIRLGKCYFFRRIQI